MHKLYFLIGASGAGKTTLVRALEKQGGPIVICYFDSIGVPSNEEMIKEFGSAEEWQRVKTIEWVKKIKEELLSKSDVILDAQTRPSFIEEACQQNKLSNFEIILVDCDDETRKERLNGRGQPELANDQMMSWAKFLRNDCRSRDCKIFNNSKHTREESLSILKKEIGIKT